MGLRRYTGHTACLVWFFVSVFISKKERDARARNFMRAKILTFVPLFQQWLSMVIHIVVELKNRFSVRNREDDDAVALAAHI